MNKNLRKCYIGIKIQILIAVVVILLQPSSSWSCSTPVFRHALERWYPDLYQAVVIHKGALAWNDSLLLQTLQSKIVGHTASLNLQVQNIDLKDVSKSEVKRLIYRSIPSKLPVIAIWYPGEKGNSAPLWIGSLSQFMLDKWGDSPVCRQLSDHLILGHSGVWLFLECGISYKDSIAYHLLKSSLQNVTQQLRQFEQNQTDTAKVKFEYRFSILRISQKSSVEQALVKMLVNSNPDLIGRINEPMVFPVFGRGRLLYSLVGEDINAETINNTAMFITGPCGCQIKELNPGIDLLIHANWEKAIFPDITIVDPLPELTGIMPLPPETDSERLEPQPLRLEESGSGYWTWIIGCIILLIFIVAIISVFMFKSNRENI